MTVLVRVCEGRGVIVLAGVVVAVGSGVRVVVALGVVLIDSKTSVGVVSSSRHAVLENSSIIPINIPINRLVALVIVVSSVVYSRGRVMAAAP